MLQDHFLGGSGLLHVQLPSGSAADLLPLKPGCLDPFAGPLMQIGDFLFCLFES